MFSCLEDRENVSEGGKKKVDFEWSFVPIVVVI